MSDNIIEFGRRDATPKEELKNTTDSPKTWRFTYRLPDNSVGSHIGHGYIRLSGPFLVLTDEDRDVMKFTEAAFVLMLDHLYTIEEIDEEEAA